MEAQESESAPDTGDDDKTTVLTSDMAPGAGGLGGGLGAAGKSEGGLGSTPKGGLGSTPTGGLGGDLSGGLGANINLGKESDKKVTVVDGSKEGKYSFSSDGTKTVSEDNGWVSTDKAETKSEA